MAGIHEPRTAFLSLNLPPGVMDFSNGKVRAAIKTYKFNTNAKADYFVDETATNIVLPITVSGPLDLVEDLIPLKGSLVKGKLTRQPGAEGPTRVNGIDLRSGMMHYDQPLNTIGLMGQPSTPMLSHHADQAFPTAIIALGEDPACLDVPGGADLVVELPGDKFTQPATEIMRRPLGTVCGANESQRADIQVILKRPQIAFPWEALFEPSGPQSIRLRVEKEVPNQGAVGLNEAVVADTVNVPVINQRDSQFGAGWSWKGLSRLHFSQNKTLAGGVVYDDGDGHAYFYSPKMAHLVDGLHAGTGPIPLEVIGVPDACPGLLAGGGLDYSLKQLNIDATGLRWGLSEISGGEGVPYFFDNTKQQLFQFSYGCNPQLGYPGEWRQKATVDAEVGGIVGLGKNDILISNRSTGNIHFMALWTKTNSMTTIEEPSKPGRGIIRCYEPLDIIKYPPNDGYFPGRHERCFFRPGAVVDLGNGKLGVYDEVGGVVSLVENIPRNYSGFRQDPSLSPPITDFDLHTASPTATVRTYQTPFALALFPGAANIISTLDGALVGVDQNKEGDYQISVLPPSAPRIILQTLKTGEVPGKIGSDMLGGIFIPIPTENKVRYFSSHGNYTTVLENEQNPTVAIASSPNNLMLMTAGAAKTFMIFPNSPPPDGFPFALSVAYDLGGRHPDFAKATGLKDALVVDNPNGLTQFFDGDGLLRGIRKQDNKFTIYSYRNNEKHAISEIVNPAGQNLRFFGEDRISTFIDPYGNSVNLFYYIHPTQGNKYTLNSVVFNGFDGKIASFKYCDADGFGCSADEFFEPNTYLIKEATTNQGFITKYHYNRLGGVEKIDLPQNSQVAIETEENPIVYSLKNGPTPATGKDATLTLLSTQEGLFRNFHGESKFRTNLSGQILFLGDTLDRETVWERNEFGSALKENGPTGLKVISYNGYQNPLTISRNGETTSLDYKNGGVLLSRITEPSGLITSLSYVNGLLGTLTKPGDKKYIYSYDKKTGLLESVTDPIKRKTSILRDANGNPTSIQIDGADGPLIKNMGYDRFGLTSYVRNPDGTKVETMRDFRGHLIHHGVNNGPNITNDYFQMDGRVGPLKIISTTEAGGQDEWIINMPQKTVSLTTSGEYVRNLEIDSGGSPIKVTDAKGRNSFYEYDNGGRMTLLRNNTSEPHLFSYDEEDKLKKEVSVNGLAELEYDSKDRIVRRYSDKSGGNTHFKYDKYDNVTSVTNPNRFETKFGYDKTGRFLSSKKPRSAQKNYKLDDVGRPKTVAQGDRGFDFTYNALNQVKTVKGPGTFTIGMAYDKGRLHKLTDANSKVTTYTHDPLGRVSTLTRPDNKIITYGYNPSSQITSIAQPGKAPVLINYDPLGRVSSVADSSGVIREVTYDATGNVAQETVSGDANIGYVYDNRDRLTQKTLPDGNIKMFAYDKAGRMIRAEDNSSIIYFGYKGKDLVTEATYPKESNGFTLPPTIVFFSYYYSGQLKGLDAKLPLHKPDLYSERPFNPSIRYAYDQDGRLKATSFSFPGSVPWVSALKIGYNARGEVSSMGVGHHTTATLQYDPLSRVKHIEYHVKNQSAHPNASVNLDYKDTLDYQRDKNGNVASISRTYNGQDPEVWRRILSYDSLEQLTSEDFPEAMEHMVQDRVFSYDDSKNRVQVTLSRTGTKDYQYDIIGRLISDGDYSYAYDNRGNVTLMQALSASAVTRREMRFEYNSEDLMVHAAVSASGSQTIGIRYVYDALNRRIGRVVTTPSGFSNMTAFIFAGDNALARLRCYWELDKNLNRIQKCYNTAVFVFAPGVMDTPLAMATSPKNYYHFLHDHLGSVVGLVNKDGYRSAVYDYDAFGNPFQSRSGVPNPYRFTSREWEPELGMYYFRARFYDPRTGRFLGKDKLDVEHLYAYVRNNPTNLVDAAGLKPTLPNTTVVDMTPDTPQSPLTGIGLNTVNPVAAFARLSSVPTVSPANRHIFGGFDPNTFGLQMNAPTLNIPNFPTASATQGNICFRSASDMSVAINNPGVQTCVGYRDTMGGIPTTCDLPYLDTQAPDMVVERVGECVDNHHLEKHGLGEQATGPFMDPTGMLWCPGNQWVNAGVGAVSVACGVICRFAASPPTLAACLACMGAGAYAAYCTYQTASQSAKKKKKSGKPASNQGKKNYQNAESYCASISDNEAEMDACMEEWQKNSAF